MAGQAEENMKMDNEGMFRGSMSFRIIGCGETCCTGGEELSGSGEYYLIGFVLSGKGILRNMRTAFEIQEESAFWMVPGEKETARADLEDPWKYVWIRMSGELCNTLMEHIGFSAEKPYLSLDQTMMRLAGRLIRKMGRQNAGTEPFSPEEELMRTGAFFEFFSILGERQEYVRCRDGRTYGGAEEEPEGKEEGKGRFYVETAQRYICEHYTQSLRMDELARQIGITPSYLSHVFREYNGTTPSRYLALIRVENSKRFLEQTQWTIGEVAVKSGYENTMNYTKVFRKMVGCSPTTYRKMKMIANSPEESSRRYDRS